MLLYIIYLICYVPSLATTDRLPKVSRQEQSSQLVRRFYQGCKFTLVLTSRREPGVDRTAFILGKTLYIDGGTETRSIDGAIEQYICISSPFSSPEFVGNCN